MDRMPNKGSCLGGYGDGEHIAFPTRYDAAIVHFSVETDDGGIYGLLLSRDECSELAQGLVACLCDG